MDGRGEGVVMSLLLGVQCWEVGLLRLRLAVLDFEAGPVVLQNS